jgi:hypothetical protein
MSWAVEHESETCAAQHPLGFLSRRRDARSDDDRDAAAPRAVELTSAR